MAQKPGDSVRLAITGWSDRTEREEQVTEIAGKLADAAVGETVRYRGLEIEKVSGDTRRSLVGKVKSPMGAPVAQVDFRKETTSALVDRLDDIRDQCVRGDA